MNNIDIKDLLAEFYAELEEYDNNAISRHAKFSSLPNKIKVAIGMRRVGKTYFLMQKVKSLLNEKVSIQQIFYINFEDDRLIPVKEDKLRWLVDQFYSLYPENHNKKCYLFFDEIQNAAGWPLYIRRIFDTKKVEIYLSGSSAKLLSKEIATSLRGRSMATEIWPFSFNEYLLANKVKLPSVVGQAQRDKLNPYLLKYINEGGFPETINIELIERIKLLQSYVDLVILRDIAERYSISNLSLLKYMIKCLIKNVGSGFSINKFFNDVKSQGYTVAKDTLHDYLGYIEDAYLAFAVPLYDSSIRKVQTNPKKIYTIDTGLANAFTFSSSRNYGHLFENLIYLDLRRKGHEIYYYLTQERYEIDFLSIDKFGSLHLSQVVWDVEDNETLHREERALKAAEKELGTKGKIITPKEYLNSLHKSD